jgi:formylglycine-generating enzyme required for sulfatase activity
MKMPNDLGIYDLSGNVFEWCRDVYSEKAYSLHTVNNPNYENAPADIKEEIKVGHRRVIRGGGWRYLPFRSRCGNRGCHALYSCSNALGFRLVMDPSTIAEKGITKVGKENG